MLPLDTLLPQNVGLQYCSLSSENFNLKSSEFITIWKIGSQCLSHKVNLDSVSVCSWEHCRSDVLVWVLLVPVPAQNYTVGERFSMIICKKFLITFSIKQQLRSKKAPIVAAINVMSIGLLLKYLFCPKTQQLLSRWEHWIILVWAACRPL